ncbi:MAG: TCP-1/cpn60 chaperonin family protein [Candidatus Aenigmarchaeota archaeon]|nr:TCP-1/cpn60 chaperonin family protein [Candidatus Aenigmarchaeota archaeon]
MGNLGGQPILILPEGAMRTTGRDAQKNNIVAAKAVADAVRTTLGPMGMDKMLVDGVGDIVITNDGVTILQEMDIEHPAAKMMVEVAKTQSEEAGDGTTTAVIIAGELLKRAEELLEQEIHPTVITRGFKIAKEESIKILEEIGMPVSLNDTDTLKKIAITSMYGKSSEQASSYLADIAVNAVKAVAQTVNGKIEVDTDNIKREKKHGASSEESKLIKGIVIDKEVVHPSMPKSVKEAKIALLDVALEVKETETDAEIRITSPEQMQAFIEQEQKMLKNMVEKVVASGANVLICQKGIDDIAQHYLAKKGILTCRRAKKSDMEALAKATGARVVTSLDDLTSEDLGYAKNVEERKVGGEQMTFVEDCKDPKAVTILVRGSTEHVVDEIDRSVEDAIGAVSSALEDGKIVAGAGSPEAEVAKRVRKLSEKYSGREQLAIKAFADALEIVPRSLAENGGMDPIDTLVELRAQHEKGNITYGVDLMNGKVGDAYAANIVEPLRIKLLAIKSASEAAEMILRIDDVISAGKLGGGMPGGMPPGMGGGDHDE